MARRTYNVKLIGIDDEIHDTVTLKNQKKIGHQILKPYELNRALYNTHLRVNGAVGEVQDFVMSCLASVQPSDVPTAWITKKEEIPKWMEKNNESNNDDGKKKKRLTVDEVRVKSRRLATLFWFTVESEAGAPSSCIIKDVDVLRRRLKGHLAKQGLGEDDIESWMEDVNELIIADIRKGAVWVDRNLALDNACKVWSIPRDNDMIFNSVVVPLFGPIQGLLTSAKGDRDFNQKTRSWSGCLRSGNKSDWEKVKSNWEKFQTLVNDADKFTVISEYFRKLDDEFDPAEKKATYFDVLMEKTSGSPSSAALFLKDKFGTKEFDEDIKKDLLECIKKTIKTASEKSPLPPERISSHIKDIFNRNGIPLGADDSGPVIDQACRRIGGWRSWLANQENERWTLEDKTRKLKKVDSTIINWLDDYREKRRVETGSIEEYQIHPRQLGGWKAIVDWWKKEPQADETRRIEIVREVQADNENKFGDVALFEAIAKDDAEKLRVATKPLQQYVDAKEAEWKAVGRKVPMMRHVDAHKHPVFIEFGNSRHTIKMNISEEKRSVNIKRQQNKIEKLRGQVKKLKEKENKNEKDTKRFEKFKSQLSEAESILALQLDEQGMVMRFFDDREWVDENGDNKVETAWVGQLRWTGERFKREISAGAPDFVKGKTEGANVPRIHRLGQAASLVNQGQAEVQGPFSKPKANGRLICDRRRLEQLDNSSLSGEARARIIDNLKWRLAITADLTPEGPWLRYKEKHNMNRDYWKSRSAVNKKRGLSSRLRHSRLSGLRVLGVDLGHRKGASCAVWETLSSESAATLFKNAGISRSPDDAMSFSFVDGEGNLITLRRIGADVMADGSGHPAPWAKLERSFVIRLQGEDGTPRLASDDEVGLVHKIEKDSKYATPLIIRLVNSEFGTTDDQKIRLARWEKKQFWNGRKDGGSDTLSGGIDVLNLQMELVRTLQLSLRRHGGVARIAHDLGAAENTSNLSDDEKKLCVASALARWVVMSRSKKDIRAGEWLERWPAGVLGVIPDAPQNEGRKSFRVLRDSLMGSADSLISDTTLLDEMRGKWEEDWLELDEVFPRIIKAAVQWCRGKKFPGESSIAPERRMGGLSIDRITMIQDTRKLQLRFKQRPTPKNLRANVPEKGDDSLRNFGRRTLDSVEQMRTNRVKQLSSRIVEAALGVGQEPGDDETGSQQPRSHVSGDEARHRPCHLVVMENLDNYRPEQNKLRRENRGLMSWSSGKINDALEQQCELHGLGLTYVSPSYTSRLDGVTGRPGIRVQRIPTVWKEMPFWVKKRIERAVKKVEENIGSEEDSFLRDVKELIDNGKLESKSIIIPSKGGTHFLSTTSGVGNPISLVDADINAARNIGIRAILDPDWSGAYFRLPSTLSEGVFRPLKERFEGSECIDNLEVELFAIEGTESANFPSGITKNLWTRVSNEPLEDRKYQLVRPYQASVDSDCISILRNQLPE